MNTLPIDNCKFKFECPREFCDLMQTVDPKVRYCDHCENNVYQCDSVRELNEQRDRGRCVALTFRPCTSENTREGDTVHVTCGNFVNQLATIERLDSDKDTAEVIYHVFGRVVPTWVPMSELGHVAEEEMTEQ